MTKCEYVRCGNSIKTLATREVKQFLSINKAKRASMEIQRDAGILGRGILRKVPKI